MADAGGDAAAAEPARAGSSGGASSRGLGVSDADAFALASPRASLASLLGGDDDAASAEAEEAAELAAALAAAQADAALAQSRETALDLEARPSRGHARTHATRALRTARPPCRAAPLSARLRAHTRKPRVR